MAAALYTSSTIPGGIRIASFMPSDMTSAPAHGELALLLPIELGAYLPRERIHRVFRQVGRTWMTDSDPAWDSSARIGLSSTAAQ